MEFASSLVRGEEDARKVLAEDTAARQIQGYIVFQLNCWNRVIQPVASSGKPVLYVDFQYGGSGGFLVYNAALLRAQAGNVGFVASSNMKHLVEAVKCFKLVQDGGQPEGFAAATARVRARFTPAPGDSLGNCDEFGIVNSGECLRRLKTMKLLAYRDQTAVSGGEVLGIRVEQRPFAELNDAWSKASKEEATAIAREWVSDARVVEGVSDQVLQDSAAMYLAQKTLLREHGAQGITINCLGGFYGGHIHAYPCLGFHRLLNEGLVGACECDVRSATTMMIGTTLTQGRPGYISDPVIDTARRQIIYAHCVASNRAFGPGGPANPFDILTHSEDRQGASVRSWLPVDRLTTTLEFDASRKQILFHRAVAVANDPDDRACRTKLCATPVGDIERLFTMWDQWGWHRVTFYGDLKEPIYALAEASGWKVVEEA
jgi:hypothetical protein